MTTIPHIAPGRVFLVVITLIVIVLILIFVPVRIPHTVSAYGKLLPAREWVLVRSENGLLTSVLRSNSSGAVEEYSVTQPERGDAMQFVLSPGVVNGRSVHKGDTIGWITSPELVQHLAALQGALEVAQAGLSSARSGDKPAVVEQARGTLAQARAAFDEQDHLHTRQVELHKRNILSDEVFELSRDRLAVLRSAVTVAEAQLSSVTSGLKSEDIRYSESRVRAIESEIEAVRARMSRFTHLAPLSGMLRNPHAVDTLLAVQDEETQVFLLPMHVRDCGQLKEGMEIRFDIPRTSLSGTAVLRKIDRTVQYMEGEPVCIITAEVRGETKSLRPGLIARCVVDCPPYSLGEYLRYLWTSVTL
ncbi:MAG: hypothetical protein WBQ23_04665 [Bacteroidota bacterium]